MVAEEEEEEVVKEPSTLLVSVTLQCANWDNASRVEISAAHNMYIALKYTC